MGHSNSLNIVSNILQLKLRDISLTLMAGYSKVLLSQYLIINYTLLPSQQYFRNQRRTGRVQFDTSPNALLRLAVVSVAKLHQV